MIDQALALADVSDWQRGTVLAAVAQRLAAADPSNAALIDQALAIAGESQRTEAPARIHLDQDRHAG